MKASSSEVEGRLRLELYRLQVGPRIPNELRLQGLIVGIVYWLKKLGDLARDQSEPWAAVERSWAAVELLWATEPSDLISSLALSSIGGAFPKCCYFVETKRRFLSMI